MKLLLTLCVLAVGRVITERTPNEIVTESSVSEITEDFNIVETVLINSDRGDNETQEILKLVRVQAEDNVSNDVLKGEINNADTSNYNIDIKLDGGISMDSEENIDIPQNEIINPTNNIKSLDEIYNDEVGDYNPQTENEFYFTRVMNIIPTNIVQRQRGFVPIPILKRKQRPRKQFANRRFYRRPQPYRRFQFYPYRRYFYPSSLRFY